MLIQITEDCSLKVENIIAIKENNFVSGSAIDYKIEIIYEVGTQYHSKILNCKNKKEQIKIIDEITKKINQTLISTNINLTEPIIPFKEK